MDLIQRYEWIFYGILIIFAIMLFLCLIRAVIGPRIADRLIAVNMSGTMVIVMIATLAVIKLEGYLVDICLIYAMISFLAVVVLTKVYTGVYLEAKQSELKKRESQKGKPQKYEGQVSELKKREHQDGEPESQKGDKSHESH